MKNSAESVMHKEAIIAQTKKWIVDVVIGCNFCPFAAREVKKGSIHFEVLQEDKTGPVLKMILAMFAKLNEEPGVETVFIILPHHFGSFSVYLKLLHAANRLVKKEGFEGIFQLASFHPDYLFEGSSRNDPANYTNRSPFPMIHILREESVSRAIDSYPDIDSIPQKNMAFARQRGLAYMKKVAASCLEPSSS